MIDAQVTRSIRHRLPRRIHSPRPRKTTPPQRLIRRPLLLRRLHHRHRHPPIHNTHPLRPSLRAALQAEHPGHPVRLSGAASVDALALLDCSVFQGHDEVRSYPVELHQESHTHINPHGITPMGPVPNIHALDSDADAGARHEAATSKLG